MRRIRAVCGIGQVFVRSCEVLRHVNLSRKGQSYLCHTPNQCLFSIVRVIVEGNFNTQQLQRQRRSKNRPYVGNVIYPNMSQYDCYVDVRNICFDH